MINISKPSIGQEEINLVTKALESGWVSSQGPFIKEFEERMASFCGTKHCVLVANGTVAIHLALLVLKIGPGDEVIVPDLTFVATANAVKMAGATPVFADVSKDTWCIDPEDVRRKITQHTKAVIPVHLYGFPANMDSLMTIAKEFSIHIIEDAAEAHGAIYHGKSVGGFGAMATFSFFGNKIITTGEGGAITTDSDDYAEYARFLRDHGMSRTKRYWYDEVGYNYRMTNLQAALGVAQIKQIHNFIMERDNIINEYKRHLEPVGLILNPRASHIRPVNWITCVLLDKPDSIIRDKILNELKNFGIETRPFFYPITSLPMYKNNVNSVSENLSARGLNLPTFAGISKEQIKFISQNLIDAISKHS